MRYEVVYCTTYSLPIIANATTLNTSHYYTFLMSLSTTTTASFILTKYSRSYSSPSSQNQPAAENSEWQHFTNPVMKLHLDAKKSPSGELMSLRMRILWNIEMQGGDIDADQREVVFVGTSSIDEVRTANSAIARELRKI